MTQKIKGIRIKDLTNSAHWDFMTGVLRLAEDYPVAAAAVEKELDALRSAVDTENNSHRPLELKLLTGEIAAADKRRDKNYACFKRIVRGFTGSEDDSLRAAAEGLWDAIRQIRLDTGSQMNNESGRISALLTLITTGDNAEAVKTLRLTSFVDAMGEGSTTVRRLLGERDELRGKLPRRAMLDARAATDKAYRTMTTKLNALAVVDGDGRYDDFISVMNTMTARIRRWLIGNKAKAEEA